MKCPCCGNECSIDLAVDLNTNTILIGEKKIKANPQQAELLTILLADWPRTVSYSSIISRIYGVNEPDAAIRSIYTVACRVRSYLSAHSDWTIIGVPNRGYRLSKHNPVAGFNYSRHRPSNGESS